MTGRLGSDHFITGANLKQFADTTSESHLYDDFVERDLFKIIPKFRKPIIAAVNGVALGAGLELILMCDIVLASETASLGLLEINFGLIPGAGGTAKLGK